MTSETHDPSQTAAAALVGALGSLILAGMLFSQDPPPAAASNNLPSDSLAEATAKEPVKLAPVRRPSNVDDAARLVDKLDARIALSQKKWKNSGRDWISLEAEAAALAAKSRLTGDLDLLTVAEKRLELAFKRAPQGSGPWIALANLQLTQHRLAEAEAALDGFDRTVIKQLPLAAAAAALRGDIALQRGDFNQATVAFKRAVDLSPQTRATAQVRLAHIHEQLGDKDRAEELLDALVAAQRRREGLDAGWLILRRGIFELERGEPAAALTWFDKAAKVLPGWYLIEEHRAECLALLGRLDASIALYREVLNKNDSPEFYAALSGVLAERGDQDEADAMAKKAQAGFEDLLTKHPEAMYGHALDWFLEGDRYGRAVELAEKNVELRPSPASRVKLAMAYIRAGRLDDATALLDAVDQTPYRHPDLFGARGALLKLQGDEDGARLALAEAEKLERGAQDGYGWLVPVPAATP